MDKVHRLGSSLYFTTPLWDFSVQVYSSPEVEKVSLALQDSHNANVNILLWCCWLESENIRLSTKLLEDVLITIDTVSLQTVAKLREVRRALLESGGFTKVQALSVKKHILNAELMVEKVLLQRLQDLTCRFLESKDYKNSDTDQRVLDLLYYLDFIGVKDSMNIAQELLGVCRQAAKVEDSASA